MLLKCIKRMLFAAKQNGAALMHARNITPSSAKMIANLEPTVESLIAEIQQINANPMEICDADSLEKLEITIHVKMAMLADLISAVKLQEALNGNALNESEKKLIKSLNQ